MSTWGQHITEAQFQATVIEYAELHGWKVWHFHDSRREVPDGRGGKKWVGDKRAKGVPDLMLSRDEDFIFWELKLDGKGPDVEQWDFLARAQQAGIEADVRRPADWDLIEARLSRQT